MKVTKTQATPSFQPIELKIVIESLNELHILKCITGGNRMNATAMATAGSLRGDDVITASVMLAEVYNSLGDA